MLPPTPIPLRKRIRMKSDLVCAKLEPKPHAELVSMATMRVFRRP